jgi:hypothetical protein
MQEFVIWSALTALISTLISMVLGFLWYSEKMFGKLWGQVVGMRPSSEMSPEENDAFKKGMMPVYALNTFLTFIMFFGLSFFGVFLGPLNLLGAVIFGGLLWLAFVMPIFGISALWSGKPKNLAWKMFLVPAGYQLVCFIIAGIVWSQVYVYFIS